MEKVLNTIYDWIDKIGKHNFMLLVFILIVTIVTGLYTTFSIVTSTDPSEIIDGLLTYKFILTQDSDTNSVTIAANSSKLLDITVSNEEKTKLQYGIYYSSNDDLSSVNLGYVKNSTSPSTGLIEGQSNYVVTIKIDNPSDSNITINFGLVFGLEKGGDLIIPDGSNLINKYFEYGTATTYIKNLYEDGSSINTVNIGGDTSKPQVHLNETQSIMLDNNGEYRYYGATPNNYVEFNGELWRIISSGTVYSSETDTTGSQRLRIIRADSIGAHPWDYGTDGADYDNDWSNATLNTTLNGIYYNRTSGTCYLDGTETTCDYSDNGDIKGLNDEAKSLIDATLWYLGGDDFSSSFDSVYADDYYDMERNNLGYGSNPTRYTDKVGIMYPSDYAYAADLSVCTKNTYYYNYCQDNNWLYIVDYQLTITPGNTFSDTVVDIDIAGSMPSIDRGGVHFYSNAVRPVAVLKSNVEITGGLGTESSPYKLSIELTEESEPLLTEHIESLYNDGSTINTVNIADDTSKQAVSLNDTQKIMYVDQGDTYGEEYRYYGSTPNNYVDFNGELWRIISSSKVFSSESDTTGETRVRIIKDTPIGNYAWDSDADYNNNWTDATLMCQLNTMYYNDSITACDGKSLTSLTTSLNDEARSLIDNALWYLGGGTSADLYADDYYNMERNNSGYGSNPTRWIGKVGIMYPSDYAYAADLSVCKNTGRYYNNDTTNCTGTDWLFNSAYQWLMSPNSGASGNAWLVHEAGYVYDGAAGVVGVHGVRPLAVLKSDVTKLEGEGTSGNPYKLGLGT